MAKRATVPYVMKIRKECHSVNDAVNRILTECKITEPPVDIEKITKSMDIDLFGAEFIDDNLLGILVDVDKPIKPFKSQRFIAVNNSPDNYLTRRIFTIAHEVGHYILHCNKNLNYYERHLINNANSDSFGERQTDYFAACLLMPENMFKTEFEKIKSVRDIELIVEHLKKKFNVSTKSVLKRMSELKLIKFADNSVDFV